MIAPNLEQEQEQEQEHKVSLPEGFEYCDKSLWSNSLLSHGLFAALVWLPITALMVAVALQSQQLPVYLFAFSLSLMLGLWLFSRAQTSLAFPTLEMCDRHLVLNPPIGRRTVYNLDCIEGARFIRHILYFRHNGWPVICALPRMPKTLREPLVAELRRYKRPGH